MSDNSLFDPDREIQAPPAQSDKRVGVFVVVVVVLLVALLVAFIAYYFMVIRPFVA
jgi:flagellar basal body-associated protein FliL